MHDTKIYKCLHCDKVFSNEAYLQKHTKDMHEQPFKCDKCPLGFGYVGDLERHISTHSNLKPQKCDKFGCNKTFRTAYNLKSKVDDRELEILTIQNVSKPYKIRFIIAYVFFYHFFFRMTINPKYF